MVSEPSIHGISSKKMVWATHGGSRCGQCLDQYRGGVHGGGARHLFDEMPSHREATPGGVLRVTVSHVLYPVNEEVLHQVFDAYGAGQVVVLERADHVEALVRFRSSRDAERARDVTHGRCVYDGCCWLDVQYMTPSDSIVATPATFSTLGLSHNTDVSMAATTSAAVTLTTSTTSAAATTTFLVTGAREAPRDELKELDPEETSKEPKVTVQELCKKIIATLNSMIESGHDVNLDTSSSVVEPTSHYVVSLPTPPATGKWNDIIVSSPVPPVTADSVRDRPEHSDDHKVFEQILDKSTVVLWPPTIRMTERQPGTPPVQVEVVREGAELRLTLGLAFICYQGDSQLKQPWPPPPFHVEQQKLLSGCVSKVPVRSRNKIVLLKKQAVFILDDLLLEQLFEKQSQQPLFAWYSLARTTFLSQAKLKEIYNIIGVQKISKADSKDECNNIQLDSVTTVRTGRMPLAFEVNALVLAASCLQMFLQELPDELVVSLLLSATEQQQLFMVGHASFLLYCLLSEVAMNIDPRTETIVCLSEKLIQLAVTPTQKQIAFHQLGCIRLLSKECNEAEHQFEVAFSAGHGYSMAGLARIAGIKGKKVLAYEKLSSVITSSVPLGWMYLERSLYSESDRKLADLDKATELDPTLTYPYMYRAASLMRKKDARLALEEINRLLGFKLALECLELRICLYLALEDYKSAVCDIHTILTLSPEYRMLEGRVAASKIGTLLRAHVEQWNTADCWLQLYERWSSVDDIGSLSVIYRMLESDAAKGVLYFRQSLLLLRLNCPEAAMRSLQLARQHAATEHERLVYEGWLLYDTGHCEEALQKAEESISIQRSFEAFFLKAYVLADSGVDPSYSVTVISLLEDALKCPSDRLRKGQALNNLGGVYVDCGKLDSAADCYTSALKIRHTRAHQGLARVHFLRNNRDAAYDEMTKLIEKAKNNASAYEKRSEYCEREQTMTDLQIVTQLDPLRVYPYRYRAAVLMDSHKEKEAIAELTRAIAFKADLNLLHLRAAFHEHVGDVPSALIDCRAALSLDPNHQEMLELQKRVNSQEP